MSNATLSITATVTGGAGSKDTELQQCHRVAELALSKARITGSGASSGTVTEGNATATWSYGAVALK